MVSFRLFAEAQPTVDISPLHLFTWQPKPGIFSHCSCACQGQKVETEACGCGVSVETLVHKGSPHAGLGITALQPQQGMQGQAYFICKGVLPCSFVSNMLEAQGQLFKLFQSFKVEHQTSDTQTVKGKQQQLSEGNKLKKGTHNQRTLPGLSGCDDSQRVSESIQGYPTSD